MTGGMNRRDILKRGAMLGAGLALPGRALADTLTESFDAVFINPPPVEPVVPALPITAPFDPAYDRRVVEIARREAERAGRKLWRTDLVGIADYGRPSTLPRFHFVNLEAGTMRSFLVAHGRGSDPDHSGWLQRFSNEPGSLATSRGAYLTCEWYNGKYGTSIRLEGLDGENSNALGRAIVIHPATYADPAMIARFGKLGRSEGCFAMGPKDFNEALWHLSGGRLLFADRITTA